MIVKGEKRSFWETISSGSSKKNISQEAAAAAAKLGYAFE